MKAGIIYKVTNEINGKCYIGATTQSLNERKKDHINKIDKDYGYKFHKALQEYGVENFVWEEIDTATNLNELALKESKYIEKYNSFNNGYNSDRGGGFKKPIYKFNFSGELISTFESLESAANSVNAYKNSISNNCLEYNKTCKGFIWSYKSTLSDDLKLDLRKKGVNQISIDGEIVANFESASEASRITGFSKTCITRCCRNERKQSGGFIWEYSQK